MSTCYLIEYRDQQLRQTTGYLRDIHRCGGFDVVLTRDPHLACKFATREAAQAILDDASFTHAMGDDHGFVVEEHAFL